jgi:hypothetical protein
MAKSTTTTKAKTKTTKSASRRPAARSASAKTTKTAAKSRAVKTTTKAKTTKSVAKTPAKAEVKKATVRTLTINRPFILTGLAFAILAGLAGFFMKGNSAQVFLGHLAKNELASTTTTVFAAAAHPLYEIEFRWLLVVLLGVSAIFAIVRGTRWQAKEAAGVKAGVQPTRWIDFAVTGAIMYEIVALLNGLQDAVGLKLGMLSVVLVAYFAWMYERENAVTGKPARASLIGAQLAALVPVLALLATVWGTYVYGIVRAPWYAYAALVVFVLWLVSVVVRVKRTPAAGKQSYLSIDKAYNVQSVLVKLALAVILIVGLYDKK